MKKVCAYMSSFILGFILFIALRPIAMAHRVDPSLIGGEILLIFAPALILGFVESYIKSRNIK